MVSFAQARKSGTDAFLSGEFKGEKKIGIGFVFSNL